MEGMLNVESDHQPLEMIMRKNLNDAPKRLQRIVTIAEILTERELQVR